MTLFMYFWVGVSSSGSLSTKSPLASGSCYNRILHTWPLSQHSLFVSRQETEIKRNNMRERNDQHWNYPENYPCLHSHACLPSTPALAAETLVQDLQEPLLLGSMTQALLSILLSFFFFIWSFKDNYYFYFSSFFFCGLFRWCLPCSSV